MLSQPALDEFKKMIKEEYGLELPDSEVLELAVSLLSLFDAVYRPIRKDWNDED